MTRAEQRRNRKLYERDFAAFCKIIRQYFPEFTQWLCETSDPRQSSIYEIEVMLMTVIMKNICSIQSMQGMTEKFNDENCVENLCRLLGVGRHEFLPHYVTVNEFLKKLDTGELETLRRRMIKTILRRRKFEDARFLGKYWLVIFDATGLFHFHERHCAHCLKKTLNKGSKEEKTIYYHNVLEAKLVLGEGLIISLGTEFIENEREDVEKNDCETRAFHRLASRLKQEYPRLPVCVLADSLYASEPVFKKCKENKWHYLIRYKDGSIPSIAEEYHEIEGMGQLQELEREIAREYPRKGRVKEKQHMEWVPELEYKGHKLTMLALLIETEEEKKGKTTGALFQWLTDLIITGRNAEEFAKAGRSRWEIENEGFNMQKNIRYDIEHANSLDYNGMKCHYLLTQIADILLQLYENGNPGIEKAKGTKKNISSDLLKSFGKLLTEEDIFFIETRSYIITSV